MNRLTIRIDKGYSSQIMNDPVEFASRLFKPETESDREKAAFVLSNLSRKISRTDGYDVVPHVDAIRFILGVKGIPTNNIYILPYLSSIGDARQPLTVDFNGNWDEMDMGLRHVLFEHYQFDREDTLGLLDFPQIFSLPGDSEGKEYFLGIAEEEVTKVKDARFAHLKDHYHTLRFACYDERDALTAKAGDRWDEIDLFPHAAPITRSNILPGNILWFLKDEKDPNDAGNEREPSHEMAFYDLAIGEQLDKPEKGKALGGADDGSFEYRRLLRMLKTSK